MRRQATHTAPIWAVCVMSCMRTFYGGLVYKLKQILGRTDFSDQFRKIIIRHKRIGYDLNLMRQFACLVINPITIDNFAVPCNCTPKAIHFIWLGPKFFRLLLGPPGLNWWSSVASDFQLCCLANQGSLSVTKHVVSVESSSLLLIVLKFDLLVCRPWWSIDKL